MPRPLTREELHERLVEALAAMPTTYNGRDLQQLDGDAWHHEPRILAETVEDVAAPLDHLAFSLEFARGTRGAGQRVGAPRIAVVEGAVHFSFHVRPDEDLQLQDYRRAMTAAELVAHTLEGGWHAGAAVVEVTTDWDPRVLPGQPTLVSPVRFTLTHDRVV